ncbi:hypothetical protein LB542_21965 [Mesorhizobium sp. BR1-1-9]|uniref:hypothetical protein n=1 Tax=Mesorhizobium sp. BR1-1-9 TaxID=2876646 RepID=UPI001CD191F4|nr:hypothetical protein [Mesorhizobium sp. BR1-1-9]MBZ9873501.1 hypothetical protein [Mesorhizobium sp. BR1-1-9]
MDIQMPPESKSCVSCGEFIPATAEKCHHCGSYQGLRRHFDASNSALALLIALISVVTLAADRLVSAYGALFKDPLLPIVAARVVDIDIDKVELLLSNNGTSRAYLIGGALCRVPVVKLGTDLTTTDGAMVRHPHPYEIEAVYSLSYHKTPQVGLFLEPNAGTTASFPRSSVFQEDGEPFNLEAKEIAAYCFVDYVGQGGSQDGSFVTISPANAMTLGQSLARFPRDQLVNMKAVAKEDRLLTSPSSAPPASP